MGTAAANNVFEYVAILKIVWEEESGNEQITLK